MKNTTKITDDKMNHRCWKTNKKRAYHVHQTGPKEAFGMDLSPKALTNPVKKPNKKAHWWYKTSPHWYDLVARRQKPRWARFHCRDFGGILGAWRTLDTPPCIVWAGPPGDTPTKGSETNVSCKDPVSSVQTPAVETAPVGCFIKRIREMNTGGCFQKLIYTVTLHIQINAEWNDTTPRC